MVLSFPLSFKTRARNQGVRAKTAHRLSTLNLDLSIPKGGWHARVREREREEGGGCSYLGFARRGLETKKPLWERDAPRWPRPRRSLPFPPLPASPGRPLPPQRNCLSSSRASPGALSIVSAFTTGSGTGKTGGCGAERAPDFLQPPPVFWVCVPSAAFICFYSALEIILPAKQPAGESDPSIWAPLPAGAAAWALCGNDVRIGGSKFSTCLRGPPFFFFLRQPNRTHPTDQ